MTNQANDPMMNLAVDLGCTDVLGYRGARNFSHSPVVIDEFARQESGSSGEHAVAADGLIELRSMLPPLTA